MANQSSNAKKQKVVEAIQQRILSGELKQGEPLRQVPLSKEFGVAQSVVRESLQRLEQHGLVTSVDNLGVFVRKLGPQELVDAYQVREVLEGLAARLCCRTVSRADVEWLEEAAHRIQAATQRQSRAQRSELEYQFHQRFLELSGNETLLRVSIGYRFVGNLVVTDRDPDQLLAEHLAVVRAVASNQPDEAERLARQHVAASAHSILKQTG